MEKRFCCFLHWMKNILDTTAHIVLSKTRGIIFLWKHLWFTRYMGKICLDIGKLTPVKHLRLLYRHGCLVVRKSAPHSSGPGAAFPKQISFLIVRTRVLTKACNRYRYNLLWQTVPSLSFVRSKNNKTQQPIRERVSSDVGNHSTRSRGQLVLLQQLWWGGACKSHCLTLVINVLHERLCNPYIFYWELK